MKPSQTIHQVRPAHKPQFGFGCLFILGVLLAFAGSLRAAGPQTLVFFGDSLTEGYGLDDPSENAYPALIQKKIDAGHLPWKVVNAGLSGDTTAGGLRRIDWVLRQPVALFFLALGANDGLRGIAPEVTEANLRGIIGKVRSAHPMATVILAGMRMPPNLGEAYTGRFAALFPSVADEERVKLFPFLLEGVGGRPELNQADGMHPNLTGHRLIAENLWPFLRPYLIASPARN